MKRFKLLGLVVGLLSTFTVQAQCDESTMTLEEAQQQLIEIFNANLGPLAMGFQTSYKIKFDKCRATVTNQANSESKQGTPTVYSFNLQDLEGKMFKFYAAKKNTQLTLKIDKKINDSNKVQYITFEGVKDMELANTLPKFISQAQCLCAKSSE